MVKRKNAGIQPDLAEATIRDVTRLLDNAKRAVRKRTSRPRTARLAKERRSGRGAAAGAGWCEAVNHLDKLIKATGQIIEQTRRSPAPCLRQRPAGSSLHDPDARPIAKGRIGETRRVRLQSPSV